MKRFVKKDRIYEFLTGLNGVFDIVWVQVLEKENLPSLEGDYCYNSAEKGRRGVIVEP